ncbi:hypothetical protein MHYP_G00104640 [Metynnis hypsauchen]
MIYINSGIDSVTSLKQLKIFLNQQPWVNAGVQLLLKASNAAFRSGDAETYSSSGADLKKFIRKAKHAYKQSIKEHFHISNPHTGKTVSGYLGENVTISCSYPEEFERNTKFFFKQNHQHFTEKIQNSETQRGRFSISDDRRSKVLSVRISDMREDDGGVYYCGVSAERSSVSYYSLYSETQLQVTGSSVIIITVCVCVALLLIGGSALIFYKLRCTKTQVDVLLPLSLTAHGMQSSGTTFPPSPPAINFPWFRRQGQLANNECCL